MSLGLENFIYALVNFYLKLIKLTNFLITTCLLETRSIFWICQILDWSESFIYNLKIFDNLIKLLQSFLENEYQRVLLNNHNT